MKLQSTKQKNHSERLKIDILGAFSYYLTISVSGGHFSEINLSRSVTRIELRKGEEVLSIIGTVQVQLVKTH